MQNVSKWLSAPLLAVGFALCLAGPSSYGQPAPNPKAEARKQIAAAQAQVNDIKAEQKRVKDQLMTEFESKEEWKNTLTNHKKAKAEYEKAEKLALRATMAKPEYKKLAEERKAAQADYEEITKQRNPNPDAIARAGTEVSKIALALKKMENDAVANDDKALATKEAFEKAEKEMKALEEEVEGALMSDPDYIQIQQQLEQAEAQVKQMRDALAQQTKSEQQAKAAAGRAASESRRAPRGAPRGARGADY
jgi:chromosome segregation ATPase